MTGATYARRYLVQFMPSGRSAAVSHGTSLLDAARLAGIYLPANCNGQGDCCECKIIVVAGEVCSLTDLEETSLAEGILAANCRLACCTRILSGVQVLIPGDSGLQA